MFILMLTCSEWCTHNSK